MKAKKKKFFREASKVDIKRECTLIEVDWRDPDMIPRLLSLEEGQALVVNRPLFPSNYRSSREFMKKGEELRPSKRALLSQVGANKKAPYEFRSEAFDRIEGPYLAGYSFRPFFPFGIKKHLSGDNRIRRISLVECLEGAKISAYANQEQFTEALIEVQKYIDAREALNSGGIFHVRTTSRTEKKGRYDFNWMSVPVNQKGDTRKFKVGWLLATEGHDCMRKEWHFRYSGRPSVQEHVFCAHEIAAYRQICEVMWKEGNKTPMVMNPFVQPSSMMIEVYNRVLDSMLIYDESLSSKDKLRTTNKADEEIALWMAVNKYGHDDTCFRESGTRLRDENWSLRYV